MLSEEGIEAARRARNQVFTVVEVMPEFPGGQGALLKFLATNVRYPESAVKNGIEGRVSCSFVVGKDGAISEAEVIRGVSPELNEEALRVINSMPVWSPGKQRGKVVNVKYTVPVTFRLSGGKKKASSRIVQRQIKEVDTSGRVFTVVQQMPEFPRWTGFVVEISGNTYKISGYCSGEWNTRTCLLLFRCRHGWKFEKY